MVTITHQEARALIHQRADRALEAQHEAVLEEHLRSCVECAGYANEIRATEEVLRIALRKHWDIQPLPLPVLGIREKIMQQGRLLDSLATRSTLVGVTLLFFMFVYSQFLSPSQGASNGLPVGIPAIPTPSLPLTSTQNIFEDCELLRYEVRQGDTLQNLAFQFSISEEQIMELNNLPAAAPLPRLVTLPVCEQTPTGTSFPPASTTNTPGMETITYTPG
jgi:hypothetical protein